MGKFVSCLQVPVHALCDTMCFHIHICILLHVPLISVICGPAGAVMQTCFLDRMKPQSGPVLAQSPEAMALRLHLVILNKFPPVCEAADSLQYQISTSWQYRFKFCRFTSVGSACTD